MHVKWGHGGLCCGRWWQVLSGCCLLQVALHDWRNLSQRLHVFDGHSEEVFQVSVAGAPGSSVYGTRLRVRMPACQQ
jgi:hypothetical protein